VYLTRYFVLIDTIASNVNLFFEFGNSYLVNQSGLIRLIPIYTIVTKLKTKIIYKESMCASVVLRDKNDTDFNVTLKKK